MQLGPTAYFLDAHVLPVPLAIPALLVYHVHAHILYDISHTSQMYMVTYCDLCEQRGGRKRLYAVCCLAMAPCHI